jgi:hypothetical protein
MTTYPGSRLRRALGPLLPLPLLLLLLLSTSACSSSTEPGAAGTLLVVNATCDSGACTPLSVYAFPENQPHTPGGFWAIELGLVMGPVSCFALPRSRHFDVTNADTGATITYTWTADDPVAVGAVAAYASHFPSPTSDTFVPARSAGWRVTLPDGGGVAEDQACEPEGAP